jgi:hypothetical protein
MRMGPRRLAWHVIIIEMAMLSSLGGIDANVWI